MGYPDQALESYRQAVTVSRDAAHPNSLAMAICGLGEHHLERGHARAALDRADQVLALAGIYGLNYLDFEATALRGRALVQLGQAQAGLDEMGRAYATHTEQRIHFRRSIDSVDYARAYALAGKRRMGLSWLDRAESQIADGAVRCSEAELHRLRGELLLMDGGVADDTCRQRAEDCFIRAVNLSLEQEAKMWELRATLSLARMWCRLGKREEARQKLVAMYGWFTEGFGTADLREARALLEELARQAG